MRDVAARAQVSFKTVSRVVNEEGGVSPVAGAAGAAGRSRTSTSVRTSALASCAALIAGRPRSGCCSKTSANPFSAAVPAGGGGRRPCRAGSFVLSASLDEDAARERALCQAVRRPARRRAGTRARGRRPVLPGGRAAGGHGDRLRRPGRRATCRSTRCSPPTRSAPRRGCGTSWPRATGGSPTSATGRRSPPRVQRLRGLPRRAAPPGLPPTPALVVQDLRDAAAADGAVTALLSRPDPPTALLHRPEPGDDRRRAGAAPPRSSSDAGWRSGRRFDDFLLAELLSPEQSPWWRQDARAAIGRHAPARAGCSDPDRRSGARDRVRVRPEVRGSVPDRRSWIRRSGSGEITPPTAGRSEPLPIVHRRFATLRLSNICSSTLTAWAGTTRTSRGAELESVLSGRPRDGSSLTGGPEADGGDSPAWSRKREPYEPPALARAGRSRRALRRAALPLQLQLPRRREPPRGAGRGGRTGSGWRPSRSPTTTGCTGWCGSPRPPPSWACPRCSAPSSRSACPPRRTGWPTRRAATCCCSPAIPRATARSAG